VGTKVTRERVVVVVDEDEVDLDPVRVRVCRVGCYDDHHRSHRYYHHHHLHQPPRLPIFFVLIESSVFLAKGKGCVFSPIAWRVFQWKESWKLDYRPRLGTLHHKRWGWDGLQISGEVIGR